MLKSNKKPKFSKSFFESDDFRTQVKQKKTKNRNEISVYADEYESIEQKFNYKLIK